MREQSYPVIKSSFERIVDNTDTGSINKERLMELLFNKGGEKAFFYLLGENLNDTLPRFGSVESTKTSTTNSLVTSYGVRRFVSYNPFKENGECVTYVHAITNKVASRDANGKVITLTDGQPVIDSSKTNTVDTEVKCSVEQWIEYAKEYDVKSFVEGTIENQHIKSNIYIWEEHDLIVKAHQ